MRHAADTSLSRGEAFVERVQESPRLEIHSARASEHNTLQDGELVRGELARHLEDIYLARRRAARAASAALYCEEWRPSSTSHVVRAMMRGGVTFWNLACSGLFHTLA